MILIKSEAEVEKIGAAGKIVYRALQAMKAAIVPDVSTTFDLERAAMSVITAAGAESAFLGYAPHGLPPYPAATCISVNEEVVHGIPGRRVLRSGDIVSCDVGVKFNGYFGDSAWTFVVGEVSPLAQKLLRVTEECLHRGISKMKPGMRLGDVGNAVERHARQNGFSVVRDMVGHGVGRSLHEEPQVPNYGTPGSGVVLREGMTLAIEPMINMGRGDIHSLDDNWTIVASDGKLSAHFEHTVVITKNGARILTQGE